MLTARGKCVKDVNIWPKAKESESNSLHRYLNTLWYSVSHFCLENNVHERHYYVRMCNGFKIKVLSLVTIKLRKTSGWFMFCFVYVMSYVLLRCMLITGLIITSLTYTRTI